MPFPMTHLNIAYNILSNTSEIKKPCDFMLGALAPDSVHFRDNYNSDMKKKSHLCVGAEKWGLVTNNEEWQKNVIAFMHENKNNKSSDFIYGFCCHILADIQNNIKIWTPFRLENMEALNNGMGSLYHQESADLDYVLYLLNPQREVIWKMLECAAAYDIPNVISSDEVNKMKEHIQHGQFLHRESVDVSLNKYASLSPMEAFISDESNYIRNLMYKID